MAQTWDPHSYGSNGAFVHGLAGGVMEWLAAAPGERILDLGCGDGQLSRRIAEAGAKVQGVDLSPQMAAAARARGIPVDEASAESLPYEDGTFDAVFSNAALHWVQNQDAMLAEVRRVLRPGGRFVAEMGGHGNIASIRTALTALTAVLQRHGLGDREDGVNYYPVPESYMRRMARHDLHAERIALIPRPTPLPESGMSGWLRTFRAGVLDSVPAELRESVISDTVALLVPILRDEDGHWVADYVRLRVIARAL